MKMKLPSLLAVLMVATLGLSACGDEEVAEDVEVEEGAAGEPVVVED